MTLTVVEPDAPEHHHARRNWLVAVAAAVLLLIAGLVVATTRNDDTLPDGFYPYSIVVRMYVQPDGAQETGLDAVGGDPSLDPAAAGGAVDPATETFLAVEQLRELYQVKEGLDPAEPTVSYCRIGVGSSHSWFVMTGSELPS